MFGIKFTEPATFHIPCLEDPKPHPGKLVAAFSMTAPPYYELIQADGDGITSIANGGRILYFGVWESDMARRLEGAGEAPDRLGCPVSDGCQCDAVRDDHQARPFRHRIEYVEDTAREPIEEWVRTGKYPGGIGT